jgi:hypothetical protein
MCGGLANYYGCEQPINILQSLRMRFFYFNNNNNHKKKLHLHKTLLLLLLYITKNT